MNKLKNVLYGLFFVIIIPMLLVLWASKLEQIFPQLPIIATPTVGGILIVIGSSIMVAGWIALIYYGNGLPMNISPPPKMVTNGIYAILPHPIYTGFSLLFIGYCIVANLKAGVWIVAPCMMLSCTALVFGYEKHDMKKRFGNTDWRPFVHFPNVEEKSPLLSERISAYVLVLLPWLLLYEAIIIFGPPSDAIEVYLPFEYKLTVIEWTESIYAFTYLFVGAAPLLCKRKSDLNTFMHMGLLATFIGIFCFMLFPFIAPPRPFEASGFWGELLLLERSMDGAMGALPSFHFIWALLAAWLYSKSFARSWLWYFLAFLIAASCITTGMHGIIDLIGSLLVFALVTNISRIWRAILSTTERIANSWQEWRFGALRVLMHAVYSWSAAFIGFVVVAHLVGKDHIRDVLIISVCSVVGAGVWGQFLKGKSNLARPFGFFGGLIGGTIGVLLVYAIGGNCWLLAAAFTIALPIIQGIGRLRCLVQGCCHGRKCNPEQGIVVTCKKSRVAYLAQLDQQPIYPTPLYSIFYNCILGALLIRFWTLSLPLPFIVGIYLIFSGLGRFVEESYRGVPHTQKLGGLIIYQWLALVSLIIGTVLTTFTGPHYTNKMVFLPMTFLYGFVFSLFSAFALSMDFPESNRRFSRLAPP